MIILLGLVTTTLATILSLGRLQYRLTQLAINQSQLRQLVIAAMIDTNHRSQSWTDSPPPSSWSIDVPAGQGAINLQSTSDSANTLQVRVDAHSTTSHTTQILSYQRTDSKWKLIAVHCDS